MVGRHPVAEQDDHRRLGRAAPEQLADPPVETLVDADQRVAEAGGDLGIVAWVGAIVVVPEVMPGGVALAEDRDEQVPGLAVEQLG